jgi:hypothetical protein
MDKKPSKYLPFAIIALIVIIFNLIAIFGLNVLLHDDPKHYKDAIEGNIYYGFMKHFILWPFTEFIAWKLMAFSSHFARGLYVVLLMVPLSWSFYYLFYHKFGLPRLFAFTAAIIPNILPHQWQIPAGINMSRTLYPLLIAMMALIIGLHYLEKETPGNWMRLAASAFLYLVSTQMMEQALFLFPPLALTFLGYTKLKKKHAWLLSLFSIIAAARLIQMIIFTRKARIWAPIEEIFRRIGLYFKYSLPSPDIESIYLTIFYIGFILVGFLLYFKQQPFNQAKLKESFSHMSPKVFGLYVYVFLLGWAASTIIPFVTMGGIIFPPRYSYISAYGLAAAFILSIFVILNPGFLKKYKLHYLVFTGIIIFSGVYRYVNLKEIFDAKNTTQSIIIKDLKKIGLPQNSQAVIIDLPRMAHGRNRATGYLWHALKRYDISGVFATVAPHEEKNFYDHFTPHRLSARKKYNFHGIYANQPVFFFAMRQEQNQLKQFEYVLYWRGKTRNAPWKIYHANKSTGALTTFRSGVGMEEYLLTIKQLKVQGISQSEILWGGPPNRKELKRLDRLELDPVLFQLGFHYYPMRFKVIDPGTAKKFLSILNTMAPLARNIDFGSSFRLEAVLLEDVADEGGGVTKIIHFLWKSIKKQAINKHTVELTLLKKGKGIWRQSLALCRSGQELQPDDYILGNFRVLANQYRPADHLSIRLICAPGTPTRSVLKIQGHQNINTTGSMLFIPIGQPNQR